jgi:hypothetical protein
MSRGGGAKNFVVGIFCYRLLRQECRLRARGMRSAFLLHTFLLMGDAEDLGVGSACLGDADGALGGLDHGATVADDDELGLVALVADDFGEAFDVGSVEEAVHFVEGVEGGGAVALEGEDEAEGGEGFFAPGHGGEAADGLAFGVGDEVEAAVEGIFGIVEEEGAVAVGEFGEDFLEVAVDGFVGFHEGALAQGGEGFDAEEEFGAFGFKDLEFFGEFAESGLGAIVFFQGEHVDGFHGLDATGEVAEFDLEGDDALLKGLFGDFGEGGGEFGLFGGEFGGEGGELLLLLGLGFLDFFELPLEALLLALLVA